ncbi:hypothetical protein LTR56_025049 [Elasticomyces elasticus]|nr:hypothetical protein LTR56_025049 [Elasticomyces elasticus]KAK3645012.1 hypothetical protein LTR22_014931 [Elasticomyces elasticus]
MASPTSAFSTLKPLCVGLSQAALTPGSGPQLLTTHLEKLYTTLTHLTNNLNPKLADYVFFPLSHCLKLSQKLPIHSLELCLQIIALLLQHGWRDSVEPQLAAQLIILCTLMASPSPTGFAFTESTTELQTAAFSCLLHVFAAASRNASVKATLTAEQQFPQLGQTITTLLEGLLDGVALETQTSALTALRELVEGVLGKDLSATFLPGMVGKLTKVLTPRALLRKTLTADNGGEGEGVVNAHWKETAAKQLKPALESVMRLRDHDRGDVREALGRVCLVLLKECRESLGNCSQLALETLLTLPTAEDTPLRMQLEVLLRADASLSGLLQNTMYDWLQSLPTVMQSADEQTKVRKMGQVRTTYNLLGNSGVDITVIDRMLAGKLRDSVVITLQAPAAGGKKDILQLMRSPVQPLDLTILHPMKGTMEFGQPLVRYRGQEKIMTTIEGFAQLISDSASSSSAFSADLARSLRYSGGEEQVATFWLLLTATQSALQRKETGSVDDFLNFDDSQQHVTSYGDHLEELYAFALSILNASSEVVHTNPQSQSLALRTLALRAQISGTAFRGELIDALYPVLQLLATNDPGLQSDTLTTLNILADACGYPSVKELIVENVDYLTNAVALKLNNYDLDPAVPGVIVMMVRLAGPTLIPYLEDVVESIFGVLEGWHLEEGAEGVVEGMFGVLSVVVGEGVKAKELGSGTRRIQGPHETWQAISIDGLAEVLKQRKVEEEDVERAHSDRETAPQRSWKGGDDDDEVAGEDEPAEEEEALTQEHLDEEPPPPAPKTYALLVKITDLTQHFLPSASASLRTSLLSLIGTTVPALARHENSFLPLINTLWPEIVSRLDDREIHVQAAALSIIGVLCEETGDFMRGRVAALWTELESMYARVAKEMISSSVGGRQSVKKQGRQETMGSNALISASHESLDHALKRLQRSPDEHTDTGTRLQWEALVGCLTTVVRHVPLPPSLYDEALEMLGPVLQKAEVRAALEASNGNKDAVWLAMVRRGMAGEQTVPVLPGWMGERGWTFAACPLAVVG